MVIRAASTFDFGSCHSLLTLASDWPGGRFLLILEGQEIQGFLTTAHKMQNKLRNDEDKFHEDEVLALWEKFRYFFSPLSEDSICSKGGVCYSHFLLPKFHLSHFHSNFVVIYHSNSSLNNFQWKAQANAIACPFELFEISNNFTDFIPGTVRSLRNHLPED